LPAAGSVGAISLRASGISGINRAEVGGYRKRVADRDPELGGGRDSSLPA
jgi:hypothetical protein